MMACISCWSKMYTQHGGAASGIAFHPHNPSLVATAGDDGVVRCADTRVWERGGGVGGSGGRGGAGGTGGGMLKSIETGVPLTCVSFHHEVRPIGGICYVSFVHIGGTEGRGCWRGCGGSRQRRRLLACLYGTMFAHLCDR